MTDYEFKKAILKNMRELTSEIRALREVLSRPNIGDDAVSEDAKVQARTKKRLFKCARCFWEFETDSYTTTETEASYAFYKACPQCRDMVCMYEPKPR